MAMKAGTKAVLKWLQNTSPEDNYTSQDIADALDMSRRSVDASITSGMINYGKGLAERVEGQIQMEDGKWKNVKFIHLTEKGYAYDPDAEESDEKED